MPLYRCVKCGYIGAEQVGHQRPNGSGECGYIAHMESPPMPQTPAERQEARRKRLLMEGLTEVRGIFLPPAQHAALKAQAAKMIKRAKPAPPKEK